MKAAQRLFLTANRAALVAEGSPDAAFLYAAIGDEIPDAAHSLFGLVEGALPEGAEIAEAAGFVPILRVATIPGVVTLAEAGLTIGSTFLVIGDGEIDEAQLLALLRNQDLFVQAALAEPAPGWVRFPYLEAAIEALQEHVDYDLANGRPHDRITNRLAEGLEHNLHPLEVAAIGDVQAAALAAEKEGAGVGDKEGGAGENKEDKGGENKGDDTALPPPPPDDLTRLAGVGPATAEKLAAAGLTSFAAIAAIDPASPPAIEGLPPAFDWAKVKDAAAVLIAPAPIEA